ncbi:DNA polymerase-3 subunit delta' [Pilibacter termitis]|jgi:DNA polymerase-3 subunit delta'|uniref:DNA polymerase-3 subunit delta n=1 Tax=Pilibacter termitis TaxID=263852 RepID=A0A1T4PDB9_9ENTE|nr:DNA polymerase III subunit delta' [Pilibacter termitis]SJZ88808.1 DNA polymerase-3 subunit delta' [Pilibacter termitis]
MTNFQATQPVASEMLVKMVQKKRLAHAYLFEGKNSHDIEQASIWLLQALFCDQPKDELPCEECNSCKRVRAFQHPDVLVVAPDGRQIKVDQIRQIITSLSTSSMEGGYKALLIRQAETMNSSAANSLLKYLEEPDGKKLLLLQTEMNARILPTIQSRVQTLHFLPVSAKRMVELLTESGIAFSLAKDLSFLSETLEEAKNLAEQEQFLNLREAVKKFKSLCDNKQDKAFVYVGQNLQKQVNGKEFSDEEKRNNQEKVLKLLTALYEEELKEKPSAATAIEAINEAKARMTSNVPFQSAFEALSIRLLYGK